MELGMVAAFWGVSLLLVMTPGADWAYAITAGLRNRTAPAVSGMLSGHLAVTLVVAAGVGAIVARAPTVLTVLTVAGALYLAALGVLTLARPAAATDGEIQTNGSPMRWVAKGFGVSGLNPKVFLLFVALLPQFTSPGGAWPLAVQIGVLGSVHLVSCALVYSAVGIGAQRVLGARPSAARMVSRVSGLLMIAIALFLLAERLTT
jgi:threonine/homoserine/homoserine lactone efflux protein